MKHSFIKFRVSCPLTTNYWVVKVTQCYAHRSCQTCIISGTAPGNLRDSSLFLVAIQSLPVLSRLNMRVVIVSLLLLLVLSLVHAQVNKTPRPSIFLTLHYLE